MEQLKLPQNFSICGNTKSGKTFLTNKILHHLRGEWDVLVILSPTIKLSGDFGDFQENQEEGKGPLIYKFDKPKDFQEALNDIVEQQECIIINHGKKNTPQVVVVLDDMVGNSMLRFKGPIDRLSTKSRHLNISLFVLSQRISAIPRTYRLNTQTFILFSIANYSELEKTLEESVPKSLRNPLREHINEIYDQEYNYLHVNCFASKISERLYKNGKENIYKMLKGNKQ